ncbi:MAG: SusD/RagB family nutrient-binding outer membrane lipoprotein [Saprospiraceae bacterium]|nr:SusD/RagB family nutrient-binding outer membrane lipoprotein [Saprospiraceae bacterium]MDW8483019.1 SusD/RagB family nutrient-binding outer membrane lipoprotein [Saprospiraceae bacterium]
MKKILLHSLLPLFTLVLASCNSFLGEDTNIDPNRTSDAPLNTLAPTIMFYSAEATQKAAVVANSYVQHIGSVTAAGFDSQTRNTFSGTWDDIYLNIIPNANEIIKKANATGSPYYAGIAKVIIAYNLGLGTSLWENIPFKEADNQLTKLQPSYDTQESIYNEILRLLDEAIADLNSPTSTSRPGADDLIYKGDIAKWLKAAHSLKARYLLHLAKKRGPGVYADILSALSRGISSNSEDFQLIYNDRNLSRWHQVALANNTGNFTTNFSATFINLMNGTRQGVVDPRLPIHAFKTVASDTIYYGMTPGAATGANVRYNNGTVFFGWQFAQNAPLQMITYSECKFIEAEVRILQNGGNPTPEAYAAYQEGIRANMTKMGVTTANINNFLNHPNIGVGAANLTLSHVITEKYKALFLCPEAWNDLRRYDYSSAILPGLALPANHNPDLGGQWIQRGHYPDTEAARNAETVARNTKDLNVKMWIFQ